MDTPADDAGSSKASEVEKVTEVKTEPLTPPPMNKNLNEDIAVVRNKYKIRNSTEIVGSLSQILLGLYIDPTLGEFPDLPIGPQFRFSKTNELFPPSNSCKAMVYFVRDKDVLNAKDLPQEIPILLVVFDEKMYGRPVKNTPSQKRPDKLIREALLSMIFEMNNKKKLAEKEMRKKMYADKPPVAFKKTATSCLEFQRCVLAILRRLPTSFTLEDFEKFFSRIYGPNVSTFHFNDMRSVLLAVPHITLEGEMFSYTPRELINDALGLQKMQDEIYEVIKEFQGPFAVKAVSASYFSKHWEEIRFREFASRFTNLTAFLLDHPAIEPAVADSSGLSFKIRDSIPADSEQKKFEKLKALQARILKAARDVSMPFIANGIEPAYKTNFNENMPSPAEFGYESLLELLEDHPDLEQVAASDFFDVVCFKLKNIDGHSTLFDLNYKTWLLFEIENPNSADNRLISQPFPLNGAIDSAWEEFLPQIFDFLTKRRFYKSFLVDGVEWLYKTSEDERNSLDVASDGHADVEATDEEIGRVIRFLGGKISVGILQRTFCAMFKRAISIADIIAMVSSNSKHYGFAWLEKYGNKYSYVVDKRLHGSDGVKQNVRRFVQAINDCGGDASLTDVVKRWEFISGNCATRWNWMKKIFECDSLQELHEIVVDEIRIIITPQEKLRFQNKTPPLRTEMEEGTRRLLEILNECGKGKKLSHHVLFGEYTKKYGVDFNLDELWRYFEVTKPIYLRPLLANTQIRVHGKTQWEFCIWLQEESNEDGAMDEDGTDEPRRAIKRKAEELTEQAAKKKVADVETEHEENAGEGRSVAAKETVEEAPMAEALENQLEGVHSKKNTTKFKEEAVQTEPSVPPSVPMNASSSAHPPPVALPPTSKHARLGTLVAQMLDYAEYKGKNTEELGTKILKMIIESSV